MVIYAEVLKVKDKSPCDSITGPYLVLTPAQRYDVLSSSDADGIKRTSDWAKSLLNRMGYVKRKACCEAKVNVAQYK